MPFAFMGTIPARMRTQSSGGFEMDAAVLGDHGAQPFARLGQVNVTDVNRRDEEHV